MNLFVYFSQCFRGWNGLWRVKAHSVWHTDFPILPDWIYVTWRKMRMNIVLSGRVYWRKSQKKLLYNSNKKIIYPKITWWHQRTKNRAQLWHHFCSFGVEGRGWHSSWLHRMMNRWQITSFFSQMMLVINFTHSRQPFDANCWWAWCIKSVTILKVGGWVGGWGEYESGLIPGLHRSNHG